MAGHSKWANIKRRKGAQDAQRSKIFVRLGRALEVAAREGGIDPANNARLRLAIQQARAGNMPKASIERAIRRAVSKEGAALNSGTFEGYGPDGVAVFVEFATDNRNRTVSHVRAAFRRHGGRLAEDGALRFLFEQVGRYRFVAEDVDHAMLVAIDAGAEDVDFIEGRVDVRTSAAAFRAVGDALIGEGFGPLEAELGRVPRELREVSADKWQQLLRLVEVLLESDDVGHVIHNAAPP